MLNPKMVFPALFLLLMALATMPGAGAQTAPAATNPVKPTPQSQAKAKQIYTIDCAMCHGENGNGKTDMANDMQLKLPDWTVPASLNGKTDQALFNTIRNGKDKMPPEAVGRASDTEVWNLIIYIRKMSQEAAAPEVPSK